MTRCVCHSESGDSLGLLLRFQDEGVDVGLHVTSEKAQTLGRGLIEPVDDFLEAARDADLVFFDHVGAGSLADTLRAEGVPVFGASKFQEMLELDRAWGLRTLEKAGLTLPRTVSFSGDAYDDAREFVASEGGRWVYKPSANVGNDLTHVADDAESMLEHLEEVEQTIEAETGKRPPFLLQQFVKGIECSVERWYVGGKPVPGLDNATLEQKKFLVGDLGPTVGGAGNVVLATADSKMLAATVDHLDRLAAAHTLTTCLDLNSIFAPDGTAYLLEPTCRIGYPAIQAFCAMWPGELFDVFLAMARGEVPTLRLASRVGAAVHVSVPPFPAHDATQAKGHRLVDDVRDDPQVWLYDVLVDPEERLVCAGVDGGVYVVAGTGPSVRDAVEACYDWLAESRLPQRQYRTDLYPHVRKRLAGLQKLGYLQDAAPLE